MRFVTKSEAVKDAFISELRAEGISFDVRARLGYDAFVGYSLEGTLDEIGAKIQAMDEEMGNRELIMEGFLTFKEELARVLERLRDGEHFEALLGEGHWAGDILDQLARNGALDLGDVVRLKEGVDVSKLRFQFRFPFELAGSPEEIEKNRKAVCLCRPDHGVRDRNKGDQHRKDKQGGADSGQIFRRGGASGGILCPDITGDSGK